VIENLYGKSFVLVLDATQFKPTNEIPSQRLVQFCDLVPKSMVSNMVSVLIVNPSTWFRKYIKNTDFSAIHNIIKRVTFVTSLKEIASYISPSETHLPKSTGRVVNSTCNIRTWPSLTKLSPSPLLSAVALDREPSTIFFPVSRVWKDNTQIYVKIKIGVEYVQIISKKKQEMVFGASGLTNDVYHISEIQAAPGSENSGDQANQVSFISSADRMVITLRSSKSGQLLQVRKLTQCSVRHGHLLIYINRRYNTAKNDTTQQDLSPTLIASSDQAMFQDGCSIWLF
jgi:neurofibromin 1